MKELLKLLELEKHQEYYNSNDVSLINKSIDFAKADMMFWDCCDNYRWDEIKQVTEQANKAKKTFEEGFASYYNFYYIEKLNTFNCLYHFADELIMKKSLLRKYLPIVNSDNSSIKERFHTDFVNYMLVNRIYNENKENGIAIFTLLNRHLKSNNEKDFYDLVSDGGLLADDVVLLTSKSSPLSKYTVSKQSQIIINGLENHNKNFLSLPKPKTIKL